MGDKLIFPVKQEYITEDVRLYPLCSECGKSLVTRLVSEKLIVFPCKECENILIGLKHYLEAALNKIN